LALHIFKNLIRQRTPLERRIGYRFRNPDLLRIALTHRSHCKVTTLSYERLEYLGDAVLELIASEYLYRKYTDKSEGELTVLRSILVNRDRLHEVGLALHLQEQCLVDKSLDLQQSTTLRTILGNVVESVLGAVYLDSGLRAARRVTRRWILDEIDELERLDSFNHKGQLFELCQKLGGELPCFRTVGTKGPDHAKIYKVAVYIDGEKMGLGQGHSKRAAEQEAAKKAFARLNSTTSVN